MEDAPAAPVDRIVSHVEQACRRLPFAPKCLPRAIVVQWASRLVGVQTRLVIARSFSADAVEAYHAWVEVGDDMVIGHCDRLEYSPILALVSRRCPANGPDPAPSV